MEEQANNVVGGPGQAPALKSNAGSFRPADPRINRDGRPKKSWAACEDRAPCAGRLMLLWVPGREFVQRLATGGIANLPADCEAISSRVDAARDAVAFVIRSASFQRIAKGTPLPEFVPEAAPPGDRAPCDGPLKLLVVPGRGLLHRLSHQIGPYLTNCPSDCKLVASRFDADQNALVMVIRSEQFPLVAKGVPLAEFKQDIYGVEWRR